MESIVVRPGVVVPVGAMSVQMSRSAGPGGQNVNKVASKVELRVDPRRIEGFDAGARRRLASLAAKRIDADGWLRVVSQRTRDQRVNLEDAREKVKELLLRALIVPALRRPTRPSRRSVQRRLDDKKHAGTKKRERRDRDA